MRVIVAYNLPKTRMVRAKIGRFGANCGTDKPQQKLGSGREKDTAKTSESVMKTPRRTPLEPLGRWVGNAKKCRGICVRRRSVKRRTAELSYKHCRNLCGDFSTDLTAAAYRIGVAARRKIYRKIIGKSIAHYSCMARLSLARARVSMRET